MDFSKSLAVSFLLHVIFVLFFVAGSFLQDQDLASSDMSLHISFNEGDATGGNNISSQESDGNNTGFTGSSSGKGDEGSSGNIAGVVGAYVHAAYKNSPPQYPAVARINDI